MVDGAERAWLHGGVMHILFNMMALRQLGPAVAELYGPGRTVIIYTAAAVGGFTLSSCAVILPGHSVSARKLVHDRRFGVDCGSDRRILYYGHRSGSSLARSYATSYALMLVFMGFLMAGIDNYAHAGGFGGGYLAARLLDPLKPERIDHMVIAVGCLVASILSIVASVVLGLPVVR